MKTGARAVAGRRSTRSMPGRNHHAPGTGGDDNTGTDFPSGSSACDSARAEPNVSPSASLWVTAVKTFDGGLPAIGLAQDTDLDGGIAQIRTQLHLGDACHADAWVLQVADDDLA